MLRHWTYLLLVCGLGFAAREGWAQEGQAPALRGFVTEVATGTRYLVNGQAVVCTPGVTETGPRYGLQHTDCPVRVLGEPVQVFGTVKRKTGVVEATRVSVADAAAATPVEGFALIDRVLTPAGEELARLRADGYVLVVRPATKTAFAPGSGLTLLTVKTNVWVRYAGTLGRDGTVAASALEFTPNVVKGREDRLRQDTDFDPTAVTEEDRQSGLGRVFEGVRADRLPAATDPAMQARVERIGLALVPRFQRELPGTEPTKINFRFQVVDDERVRWVVTQPSGVIQVPHEFVVRLQSDAELAAVLSAAIAAVMEKQSLRVMPAVAGLNAAGFAGMAAGLFVPGLGLATGIAGAKAASVMEHRLEEQNTRTGLTWMADAGFDVQAAPVAWWRLADRKDKGLAKTAMPYRTEYLYGLLWREGQ